MLLTCIYKKRTLYLLKDLTMNTTQELIERHEECINILDSITHFERLIRVDKDTIDQLPIEFKDVRDKFNHKIDVYQKCIERLEQRYQKAFRELTA